MKKGMMSDMHDQYGNTMFMDDDKDMVMIPAEDRMKVTPIEENYNQRMAEKPTGAKRPWIPKGRK